MAPLAGYGDAIVDVAISYLGKREIGNNSGPFVDRLLRYVGIYRPAPWCTAAAVTILHEAAARLDGVSTCPKAASGAKLWRWALRHPEACDIISEPEHLQAGDVVIMGATVRKADLIRLGKLASGHTWIAGSIASEIEGGGYHVSFEGNTNLGGSRDGQGFMSRTRTFIDPRVVGAIRFQALHQPRGSRGNA
jgi:hypothetical protein